MTFAYGRETQDRVLRALANLRNFQGNERVALSEGLTGLNGPCRRLTNSRYGALPREYAEGLDEAVYVVYCYGTPIAWVSADDEDLTGRANWVPDWQYSATTTYYQGLVMQAWGDKCRDPNPRKSRRDNQGTARGRTSDARYGRNGQSTYRPAFSSGLSDADRARVGQPSRTAPSGPPEREMTRAEYLADPRLRDPDWTPFGQGRGNNLPAGADQRDYERVEAERAQGRGRIQ